jgi:hypothetical protein
MSAGDLISIFRDLSVAGAACYTAYLADTGLTKWQEELTGKANFEVARSLIKTVYKLRDELIYARSPLVFANEFPEDYGSALRNHTDAEEGDAWSHIYSKRWDPVALAIQEFDIALLEAEALWGYTIKQKALKLRQLARELQVSMEAVINDKYHGGEDFKDRDFATKMRRNVSARQSADDELSLNINEVITDIESEVICYLSRS